MSERALARAYRAYIECLNARDWARLEQFVHDDVRHNDRPLGVAGYRAMLEADVRDIPDLRFIVQSLVCEPPNVAARLAFDCRPTGDFLGLPVRGRRVAFTEHVCYAYRDGRIWQVWSLLDKAAIEAQLGSS